MLTIEKGNVRNVAAGVCFGYLLFYNKLPQIVVENNNFVIAIFLYVTNSGRSRLVHSPAGSLNRDHSVDFS